MEEENNKNKTKKEISNKKAIIASNLIESPQIRISNVIKEIEKDELEQNYRCAFIDDNNEIIME